MHAEQPDRPVELKAVQTLYTCRPCHLRRVGRRLGELADLRAREERRGAHLDGDVGHAAPLGVIHRARSPRSPAGRRARSISAAPGEVVLERLLRLRRPGPRAVSPSTGESSPPRPSTLRCGPIGAGPNRRAQLRAGPLSPGRRPCGCRARPAPSTVRVPMPQSAVTGRWPIVPIHVRRVSTATPPGLPAEPGRRLRLQLRLADAHRAGQAGLGQQPRLHGSGQLPRDRRCGRRRTLRPTPTARRRPGTTGGSVGHRPRRCGVVGRPVGWQVARRPGTLRAASRSGIPERTPKARASRTTPSPRPAAAGSGSPSPPTTTGRPASSGRRRISTAARNWSRSTCRIQSVTSREGLAQGGSGQQPGGVEHRAAASPRAARAAGSPCRPGPRRRRPRSASRAMTPACRPGATTWVTMPGTSSEKMIRSTVAKSSAVRHHGLDAHGGEGVSVDGSRPSRSGCRAGRAGGDPSRWCLGADLVDDVQPRDGRLGLDLIPTPRWAELSGTDGEVRRPPSASTFAESSMRRARPSSSPPSNAGIHAGQRDGIHRDPRVVAADPRDSPGRRGRSSGSRARRPRHCRPRSRCASPFGKLPGRTQAVDGDPQQPTAPRVAGVALGDPGDGRAQVDGVDRVDVGAQVPRAGWAWRTTAAPAAWSRSHDAPMRGAGGGDDEGVRRGRGRRRRRRTRAVEPALDVVRRRRRRCS